MGTALLNGRRLKTIKALQRSFRNWPVCTAKTLAITFLKSKTVSITWFTNHGTKISAPPGDGGWTAVEVYALDCYGLRDLLPPLTRPRIIDIGANIGVFSLTAVELTNASILAFEPAPTAFKYLKKNVAENDHSQRIQLEQKGVVGTPTNHIKIFECAYSCDRNTSNSAMVKEGTPGSWIDVEAVTLDEILSLESRGVDILKIDIEGGEYDILLNVSSQGLARVTNIIVEYHPHSSYSAEHIVRRLEELGFVLKRRQTLGDGLGLLRFRQVDRYAR